MNTFFLICENCKAVTSLYVLKFFKYLKNYTFLVFAFKSKSLIAFFQLFYLHSSLFLKAFFGFNFALPKKNIILLSKGVSNVPVAG